MQCLPRLISRLRLLHPERVSSCRSLTTSQVCRADYREEMSTKSRVTSGDKWIIAKFGPAGKYKSSADVPDMVNNSEIDRAKAKGRIVMNTIFMVMVVLAALSIIFNSKGRAKSGEQSMEEANLARRKALRESQST